jgi:hypothetical protein
MGFGIKVEEEVINMISGTRCMRAVMDQAMNEKQNRLGCEEV